MMDGFRWLWWVGLFSLGACESRTVVRDRTSEVRDRTTELRAQLAEAEGELVRVRSVLAEAGIESRPAPWPITNAHEHMLAPRHLHNYLSAARRLGIRRTVIVASPRFTLYGEGDKGWKMMQANFERILAVAKDSDGEIIPFMTVDPLDPDKLERMQKNHAAGAQGIKIYTGHSKFYDLPLDDPSMGEVYAYLAETGLPVNWHINLTKFADGFSRVMDRHPNLNVMVPHYGVAFWRANKELPRLAELMRRHPAMYVDTSLGTRKILVDGMVRLGEPEHHAALVKFVDEFQDRIIYGSDSVITGNKEKTVSWYHHIIAATRDQLEQETFTFPLAEAYSRYFKKGRDPTGRIRGLALEPEVLQKIYVDNAQRWLAGGADR